jgi:hypothetical protein
MYVVGVYWYFQYFICTVECTMISKMVNGQMRAEFITLKEDHIHQVPLPSIYQTECIQDLLPTTWLVGWGWRVRGKLKGQYRWGRCREGGEERVQTQGKCRPSPPLVFNEHTQVSRSCVPSAPTPPPLSTPMGDHTPHLSDVCLNQVVRLVLSGGPKPYPMPMHHRHHHHYGFDFWHTVYPWHGIVGIWVYCSR